MKNRIESTRINGSYVNIGQTRNYPKWTCYGTWAIFFVLLAGFLLNAFTVGMATNVMSRVPQKIGGR